VQFAVKGALQMVRQFIDNVAAQGLRLVIARGGEVGGNVVSREHGPR
jgi:hypothetical protein